MSADPHRIDSHKLHFHPARLAAWMSGELIAPIYMEISPSGACNHRCSFCGLDFMGYRNRRLPTDLLCRRQEEMAALGLKSVMYAGEGEPFLHPDMGLIARSARQSGLDVAFTTNASLLDAGAAKEALEAATWIKASVNAGTPETYAAVHGVKPSEFGKVMTNLERAAAIKAREGYGATLGLQSLLLPQNASGMTGLARMARDAGLNYFVLKPYSQHPQSLTRVYRDMRPEGLEDLAQALGELVRPGFDVVVRLNALRRAAGGERGYSRCLALPFWSYLDSGGSVWGCSVHLGDERFLDGNIKDQDMAAIWSGERRRGSVAFAAKTLDASACRLNCRMDPVNRYLKELAHPPQHVNFI